MTPRDLPDQPPSEKTVPASGQTGTADRAPAKKCSILARAALGALAGALHELPNNRYLWSYMIKGLDGSPFMQRTLFPRIAGHRLLIHHIFRADEEPWVHNHPWRTARFLVISGGYTEQRLVDGKILLRSFSPGDVNRLDASDFHRVDSVLPGTWTIGVAGEHCQDWGFLVDGEGLVLHEEYMERKRKKRAQREAALPGFVPTASDREMLAAIAAAVPPSYVGRSAIQRILSVGCPVQSNECTMRRRCTNQCGALDL